MSAAATATYKGRTYRLLWTGPTKFGRRAKLGFMDGSKEFWVAAAAVTTGGASYTPRAGKPRRDCDDYCQGCRLCM